MAPLTNSSGEQIVVVIPNVKPETVRASDGQRTAEDLLEGLDRKWLQANIKGYVHNQTPGGVGVIGKIGAFERKNGKRFVGTPAIVIVRSTLPAKDVDAALPKALSKVYKNAERKFELVPTSQLKKQR